MDKSSEALNIPGRKSSWVSNADLRKPMSWSSRRRSMAGSGSDQLYLCNSLDSKVYVDVNSPSFKNPRRDEEEHIINSVRSNYLSSHLRRHRGGSVASSGMENRSQDKPNLDDQRNDTHLEGPGADMTRDIYKMASLDIQNKELVRTNSLSTISMEGDSRHNNSTASALNVPGGFRREYIVQKMRDKQKIMRISDTDSNAMVSNLSNAATPSDNQLPGPGIESKTVISGLSEPVVEEVPFLTRNFMEFLYIYGHFAGESFDDDFYPDEYEHDYDPSSPFNGNQVILNTEALDKVKGTTSTAKAFLLLLKSFVGTGVLFLPSAFHNGGLAFSTIMLSFFGLYSYWCYYILVKTKVATRVSSFGAIGNELYGKWMKTVILCSLVITQIGFSGAYVIFTSESLRAFCAHVFRVEKLPLGIFMLLQLACFIPLSFIRNLSKLSIPSLLANFFILGGLVIVLLFTGKRLLVDFHGVPAEGVIKGINIDRWTLYIGTAIFTYEGIGLIIPVQDSMRNPEKFPLVLGMVIIATTILFTVIAIIGYLAYGQDVKTVVLLNLPQKNVLVSVIQLLYALAIMLSTPLQLFPAIKIIESGIFAKRMNPHLSIKQENTTADSAHISSSERTPLSSPLNSNDVVVTQESGRANWKVKWMKNLLRSIIVSVVVLIGYAGSSNLDKFVAVIGSFACIPLVYVYPPMLHLKAIKLEASPGNWHNSMIYLDWILILFGLISMVYTSYQSIFMV